MSCQQHYARHAAGDSGMAEVARVLADESAGDPGRGPGAQAGTDAQ
jgi:hypothetical protein